MGVRGEIFSTKIMLPNRTYFFNVKENRMGDLYLNIVESKNRDAGGFDRQSVILFADDLQEFLKGFDESLRVLEKAVREKNRGGSESAKRTERSEYHEKSEHREKPEYREKPEREERPVRTGHFDREERSGREGKPMRVRSEYREKPEREGRPVQRRFERDEKSGHEGRPMRVRSEHREKYDRAGKPEYRGKPDGKFNRGEKSGRGDRGRQNRTGEKPWHEDKDRKGGHDRGAKGKRVVVRKQER
ncbi:MAG: DUF3276 family protein [Treponema sp.]|jgi:hypothetical protein|nr:DUF3276 family protein [Treponema sp.]